MKGAAAENRSAKYFKAPQRCTPDDGNPFADDGAYDRTWTGLALVEGGPDFIGMSRSGLFHYRFGRTAQNVAAVVADFLRYENERDHNAILFFPDDMDADALVQHSLSTTPLPHVMRESDPTYLVHASNAEAGRQILADGQVKALLRLSQEGRTPPWHSLRSDALGEPPDYAEYVNLGPIDSPWVECVPASHAAGRFLGPDNPYEPGARFYFDTAQIVNAGLDVRVVGAIKVLDRLPLDPFLVTAIGVNDIGSGQRQETWTPRSFTVAANEVFASRLGMSRSRVHGGSGDPPPVRGIIATSVIHKTKQ